MTVNPYDEVRGLVMTLVAAERANGQITTAESIAQKIEAIIKMYEAMRGADFTQAVDGPALQRDLESSFNVFIADANLMSDDGDHEPWLEAEKASIDWRFWNRYKHYQSSVNKMPPAAVEKIDQVTDMILG